MNNNKIERLNALASVLVMAALVGTPALAQVTTPAPGSAPAARSSIPDGAPGNPPSTALGRAVDRATGTPTTPDGTPGNPAGTAAGRAVGTSPPAPGVAAVPSTPVRPASAAAPVTFTAGSVMAERARMSQVLGSHVYNDRNERIGEIEDVVLHGVPQGPVAVIQVGGFLGLGGRLVAVPLNDLRWQNERIMLPGATKEQLQGRPAFDFASIRHS